MESLLYIIVSNVALSTFGSRFVRRSTLTAALRRDLSARSRRLDKLIHCSHCLCFWFALGGGALLAHTWLHLASPCSWVGAAAIISIAYTTGFPVVKTRRSHLGNATSAAFLTKRISCSDRAIIIVPTAAGSTA